MMSVEDFNVPRKLEVHPLGDNGEMEILPASDHELLTSRLPCGLPPILPDTDSILNSFLEDLDKLPIFHLDATQRFIPSEPNIHSLYEAKLCPLKTELAVRRDATTGKLLGFVEQEKDVSGGTTNTSTSLSRAPGRPETGIRGSTSSFPFWPGGMDEPWANLIVQEPLNTSLFDCDYLKVPPGFKEGMDFQRMYPQKDDRIDALNQTKISLTDIFAMEDLTNFESSADSKDNEDDIDLVQVQSKDDFDANSEDIAKDLVKIEELPVLKISDIETKSDFTRITYKWAVIEDVKQPVLNFNQKIPDMAFKWDFELDTFQKKAILHLENHQSVFVAAHTSAGKTVVAEYAIALAKKHMTRVIYTSPIKALSNQKFREFKESFEDVGLITGDVQINEKAFCLIMTTEILRSMLYHGSDVLREVEWVIFDEVHYINDAERGVVWEEVFIMLPQHVNLIMLSATVPNTAQFAEWLGGIKKRKIYVISTLKRPTPLVHYLFTGSVGISQDDCFPIIDANGNLLREMYSKAVNAKSTREQMIQKDREVKDGKSKKGQETKPKLTTGPKGPRYNVNPAQEKNIYVGLLGYLKKKDLLPVICFTLSRKRCNDQAQLLQSQNLTTEKEKNEIRRQFRSSIAKLKSEDKKLGQVRLMKEQLLQGFGVHHSGILPILKEVVEMLFQKGLVKVLFATETFAMGVNMPARTVVFDSIRKHDGLEFRTLQPSEYIQMAGRAGRRGKDSTGTVIILCKGDVPDLESLIKMMLGKATSLMSQFKLTYSMILNLLKVKTLRVEEVMKRSFGESDWQKKQEQHIASLLEHQQKFSELVKPDCSLCSSDMDSYCRSLLEMKEVMPKINSFAISARMLAVGRVVTFSYQQHRNAPGLVLNISKDDKVKMLVAESRSAIGDEVSPWSRSVQLPEESDPVVLAIPSSDILLISNKSLKIDADLILREWQRMMGMRTKPGDNISSAFQEFTNFCQANRKGFTAVKLTFQNLSLIEDYTRLQKLQDSMQEFTCIKCPHFSKHFSIWSEIAEHQKCIEDLKFQISEESLSLHTEFQQRKEVLASLGYIDANDVVQLKGSVAREMSNHELLITELLVKCVFNDCTPEEIAALLSCMVFQHKNREDLLNIGIPMSLMKKIEDVKSVIKEIDRKQVEAHIEDPTFAEQYNFHLTNVVFEWAKGVSFAKIMTNINVNVEEGIIVRCIQRLSELLKDLKSAANLVGDTVLARKMSDASALIKRDIVFAASLYIQ